MNCCLCLTLLTVYLFVTRFLFFSLQWLLFLLVPEYSRLLSIAMAQWSETWK